FHDARRVGEIGVALFADHDGHHDLALGKPLRAERLDRGELRTAAALDFFLFHGMEDRAAVLVAADHLDLRPEQPIEYGGIDVHLRAHTGAADDELRLQ